MTNTATAERRDRIRTAKIPPVEVKLALGGTDGPPRQVAALVVDTSQEGVGVQLKEPLAVGQVAEVRGDATLPATVRVAWCRRVVAGLYRAGLAAVKQEQQTAPPPVDTSELDHYETLQIHPKAEPDTIHRIYRILAQRYHPDNSETGNEDLFKRLTRAWEMLGDPEKRAAYDLRYHASRQARLRLFNDAGRSQGVHAERRKRQGVLAALYRKRLQDPSLPALSIFDLEDVLGVPREHLEFTIWFLKERGFLERSDNNRFHITAAGVEECEKLEEESLPDHRLLPAAPARA